MLQSNEGQQPFSPLSNCMAQGQHECFTDLIRTQPRWMILMEK